MAFHLHISETERAYLDALPLSPEAMERLNRFIEEDIANIPDSFRLDPENRPDPDAPYFLFRCILRDRWGDGRLHAIDFHIRDDNARFGVLLVVYIECH